VKQITDLFDRHGESRYGEHVNQREHMLQCAKLAEDAGDTPAMIAAALLHDVGQFPEEVTAPIALHVAAKRYLCAIEPGYLEALSGASALSLSLQGGPFNKAECAAFEAHPFFKEALRLRRYDDLGKQPGVITPDVSHYIDIIRATLKY